MAEMFRTVSGLSFSLSHRPGMTKMLKLEVKLRDMHNTIQIYENNYSLENLQCFSNFCFIGGRRFEPQLHHRIY